MISIELRAAVMPFTSDASALAAIGWTICHSPPLFFSDVASPADDVTFRSSILSASTELNTFSLFEVLAVSACFHVTK